MTGRNRLKGAARDLAAGELRVRIPAWLKGTMIGVAVGSFVIGLITLIAWMAVPHGGWFAHGEEFAVQVYQDGARHPRAQCSMAMVTGGWTIPAWDWNATDGSGTWIGGDTPSLSDAPLAREWYAGCMRGFAVAEGRSAP